MAVLIKDGFGQIELNQVAFRRDGRVEAQCALDPTDFAEDYAENGMILVVDKKNKTIRLPKAADLEEGSFAAFAVNYSSEHLYDERALGLKNFRLGLDDFYPRVGYPAVGDRWTTNAVYYDETTYADLDAVKEALNGGALYAIPSTQGYVEITDDPGDSSLVLEAVEWTTMPDGQPAIKFLVVKA